MDLHRFAVKFFAADPKAVAIETFIPVFHRWIQQGAVEGMALDVADYGHLPQGPGVVLIGHEADHYLDSMEGPLGLLYSRKRPGAGSLADRIAAGFKAALAACDRLEREPELAGRLKFRRDEALFIANDRLAAPNTDESFRALRADLEKGASAMGKVAITRDAADPRSRLTVKLKA